MIDNTVGRIFDRTGKLRGGALLPYFAILSARFRLLLQYRSAAVAGFATQLFWGLIRVMIFTAFYHSTTRAQPMSLSETVTYLWLTQAMYALLPWNVDGDVKGMIRTGTVAYELLRPVDLYGLWYVRALAMRIAPTVLRATPMFVLATLFLGMHTPPTPSAGLAWILATIAALLLSAAISTLVTITLLFTVGGDGITRIVPVLVMSMSGFLVPLPLLPSAIQWVLWLLPFRDLADVPFRLYSGNIPAWNIGYVLLHQGFWLLCFVIAGRMSLARATRRMVVQGG